MKLGRAALCLDCEEVYELTAACPSCGSESFVLVSLWLSPVMARALEKDVETTGR